MTILKTDSLSKIYGGKGSNVKVQALKDVNISIQEGEFVGVMGPSGSGKSTLLNILATIDQPSSGAVYIAQQNPHQMNQEELAKFRRKRLGFIFQEFNLLPSLSVEENIILPLVLEGENSKKIEQRLEAVMSILNIKQLRKKRIYEISGGEQQRVAAARAILGEPDIILADEPTGNLDSNASYNLMTMLEKLNKNQAATIVMVTHDAFAASFCERIIMIKDGETFLEINKGDKQRQVFLNEILDALSVLGGGYHDKI